MTLNAPAMAGYDSLDAGMIDNNAQVKLQGFSIVKLRSKTDKKDPPTVRKVFLRFGVDVLDENAMSRCRRVVAIGM
jgi:hypothetical protein